ncbi:MAG TPA: nicotinate-nucleotide adenylyltransferase [Bacillota bacterium]|nr:nicotinate-nucleotide adenylyltransferase [Bacillota bacterium]
MRAFNQLGIMGGTFDPVHLGHLIMAETARAEHCLDHVLFLPTGDPPHKKNRNLQPASERIKMLELALEGNANFSVSKIEVSRQGTTYTYDSLIQLKSIYPNVTRFSYIIGGDTLLDLRNWRSFDLIASLCDFLVFKRPGLDMQALSDEAKALKSTYKVKVCFMEGPMISLSSSEIRQKITQKKSIKYLVPDAIEEYIAKSRLYRGEDRNDKAGIYGHSQGADR